MSIIEQLEKRFDYMSDLPHRLVTEPCEDLALWNKNGKPFEWQLVESDGDHHVYVDTGYGWMALFNGETLVDITLSHVMTSNDVVVLHRGYYGVTKYIWK
jgi:hypothetical protein